LEILKRPESPTLTIYSGNMSLLNSLAAMNSSQFSTTRSESSPSPNFNLGPTHLRYASSWLNGIQLYASYMWPFPSPLHHPILVLYVLSLCVLTCVRLARIRQGIHFNIVTPRLLHSTAERHFQCR
jgi:hypothetical protein